MHSREFLQLIEWIYRDLDFIPITMVLYLCTENSYSRFYTKPFNMMLSIFILFINTKDIVYNIFENIVSYKCVNLSTIHRE